MAQHRVDRAEQLPRRHDPSQLRALAWLKTLIGSLVAAWSAHGVERRLDCFSAAGPRGPGAACMLLRRRDAIL